MYARCPPSDAFTTSLLSISPLCIVRSWRIAMWSPYGRSPGSHRSTVSSTRSLPSSASWRIRSPQILLTLSSRKRASARISAPERAFATPAAPSQLPRGPRT